MSKNFHICIGNAAVMNIMKKGNEHSDALMRGPSLIDKAFQEQGAQASWDYIASAESAANGISRRNGLRNLDAAKGWRMRRSAEGEVKNALPLPPSVFHSFQTPSFSNYLGFLRILPNCLIKRYFNHTSLHIAFFLAGEIWERCVLFIFFSNSLRVWRANLAHNALAAIALRRRFWNTGAMPFGTIKPPRAKRRLSQTPFSQAIVREPRPG
ncbi:hypothetical protein TRVL_02949 [Trypanosoma vivax]|nr:hypothetical protein TRVL_02949 [Trypanosoma vivax]